MPGLSEGSKHIKPGVACLFVLLGVFGLYVALLNPDGFGYYSDDAIYATTAKALATGHGYRLISLPGEPVQTKYPPLYPFLLSLIWRVSPNFPANLTPMLLMSVAASVLASALTWFYLAGKGYASKWVVLLVVGLAAINLNTIQFATGIFSEMPYAALSIGALLLAEEREKNRDSWPAGITGGVILGLLIGLAILTRIGGITLLPAIGLYFAVRKRTKEALVPIAIGGLFVVCWFVWAMHNRTPYGGTNGAYYTDYLRYTINLIKRTQALEGRSFVSVLWSMTSENAILLLIYSAPLQAFGLTHEWLGGLGNQIHEVILVAFYAAGALSIALGIRRHIAQSWRLMPIYVSFYLLLHAFLPYPNPAFFSRYLVPIVPFLLFFLVTEVLRAGKAARTLLSSSRQAVKFGAALASAALVIVVSLGLANYVVALAWELGHAKDEQEARNAQTTPVLDWIRANTSSGDVIASANDGLYYLYTGRKATLCFSLDRALEPPSNQEEVARANQGLVQILRESHAAYLALTAVDAGSHSGGVDYLQVLKDLGQTKELVPVFISRSGQSAVYRVAIENAGSLAPPVPGN